MSTHYTDADVQAATAAMREASGLAVASLSRVILDAVAPAIAARALREAAEVLSLRTEGTGRVATARWKAAARDAYSLAIEESQSALHTLADEIERT
jgi:hypothetical protein